MLVEPSSSYDGLAGSFLRQKTMTVLWEALTMTFHESAQSTHSTTCRVASEHGYFHSRQLQHVVVINLEEEGSKNAALRNASGDSSFLGATTLTREVLFHRKLKIK